MSDVTLQSLAQELKEVLRYVKKLEHSNKSLRGSIATCKKSMREYSITNKALVKIYRKVTDRMSEIELDYRALSKIQGMRVTLFKKRNVGGDWCMQRDNEGNDDDS